MKITGIEGSGICDLEEDKVDTINDNLPPWVEVDESLEGGDSRYEAESSMKA